jgi:hypothetical protein
MIRFGEDSETGRRELEADLDTLVKGTVQMMKRRSLWLRN